MSYCTKDMIERAYDGWKTHSKETDTVMFLHYDQFQEARMFSAMNNTEMQTQMRLWRKLAKEGKVTIRFVNSKSKTLEDGNTWHWLVIQRPKCWVPYDTLGTMLLGFMVSGHIYCFKSKVNRDRVQEYVMKGLEQLPIEETDEE